MQVRQINCSEIAVVHFERKHMCVARTNTHLLIPRPNLRIRKYNQPTISSKQTTMATSGNENDNIGKGTGNEGEWIAASPGRKKSDAKTPAKSANNITIQDED